MRRTSILLAEDDLDLRETLQVLLEDLYEVHVAANGEQALDVLTSVKIDLVLFDFNIPSATGSLNGAQLTRVLADMELDIPVIWFTGESRTEIVKQAWRMGVYEYLEKPFNTATLLQSITRALENGASALKVRDLRVSFRG
jgi:DNA-binding NtrC family response regulator